MRLLPSSASAPWDTGPAGKRGILGEEAVIAALSTVLDDRYLALARLHLPGTPADMDLVIVAARITVIEVKTYRGPRAYRCHDRVWSYVDAAGNWRQLDAAPGTQAAFGALRVRRRLRNAGLPAVVQSVVAWAGDAPLDLRSPRFPVLRPPALAAWLAMIPPATAPRAERLARTLLYASPAPSVAGE